MSPLEQDAVLDVCLRDDLDAVVGADERGGDPADYVGNDLDLAIEEMTDDERRIRRVNNIRSAEMLIISAQNVVRMCRDAVAIGGTMAPGVHELALTSMMTALKKLDRALELEGE